MTAIIAPPEPRCTCTHRRDHHVTVLAQVDGEIGQVPTHCNHPGCLCQEYRERRLWTVRRDEVHAFSVAIHGPWRVIAPSGAEVHRSWSHRTALELANRYAALDELLARVHRLERNTFGAHPALRAPASSTPGYGGGGGGGDPRRHRGIVLLPGGSGR